MNYNNHNQQRNNSYPHHFYNSDSNESNKKDNKKLKYILSISKKHIIFFLFLMFSVFGLFFVLGLMTGYKVGKNINTPPTVQDLTSTTNNNNTYDNYNNYNAYALSTEANNNITNNSENLEFVSKEVIINEDFNKNDVLKTSDNFRFIPMNSLESSIKKKSTINQVSAPNNFSSEQKEPSVPIVKKEDKSSKQSPYVRKPVPGVKYYYIQVIATKDVARAQNIYQQLKKRSFPVNVKKSEKNGQMLYAIRVGLYKEGGLAAKHLRRIRKGGGYTTAFMKPYLVPKK